MSSSEKIAAVPGTYEPYSEEEGNTVTVPASATRRRTEKRFEIGLFLRRRFRRRIIHKHEVSVGAGSLAPSEKKESETPQPAAFAMSARGGGGGPQDDSGLGDPQPAGVLPGDDSGPITGTTSYEVGAFAAVTSETTTKDDDV